MGSNEPWKASCCFGLVRLLCVYCESSGTLETGKGFYKPEAFMLAIAGIDPHEVKPILNGRYYVTLSGDIYNARGKKLKPGVQSRGYLTVSLYTAPKTCKSYLVHRLVATAFLGESPLEVNHKDGNKRNNSLSNLEFVTSKQNARHAAEVLGRGLGESNANCKLTDEQIAEIRRTVKTKSAAQWARELSMNSGYILQIRWGQYRRQLLTGATS